MKLSSWLLRNLKFVSNWNSFQGNNSRSIPKGIVFQAIAFINPLEMKTIAYLDEPIDTTRQIAETLYFSLSGVDTLHYKGLRCVFRAILGRIC